MNTQILQIATLVMLVSLTMAMSQQATQVRQMPQRFEKEIHKTVSAEYLLYLPKEYGVSKPPRGKQRKWPLLLFLHGSGERGSDLELVKRHGPPKLIEQGKGFEFVVVSPQCPAGEDWSTDMLNALLDEIIATYSVDENHIYATGLSMGGTGVWDLAIAFPDRFAAIAPVCGKVDRNNPGKACRIKSLPIWVFHGAKDDVVPISDSEKLCVIALLAVLRRSLRT